MSLSTGDRLGAFEILDKLGEGGMGEVYRARDTRLDRTVAIKVISSEAQRHPDQLARFEREARSASALNHPNIVTIYEVGHADGTPFIAMEHVAGQTLREKCRAGQLSMRKILDIAVQVADGMAKAHEAGIVHRDLKPENVMINADGRAKILDFGLARPQAVARGSSLVTGSAGLTEEGMVLGTVSYMSPEQALGEVLDTRSDQFAFGSMLYEMVTGARAFQRDSKVQTMSAIIDSEPEPVAKLNPKTPAALQQIIQRCMEKERARRYASTTDLAHDLEIVRQQLTSSTASSIVTPRSDWRRKLAMTGVAALVFLGAVWAGALLKDRFGSVPFEARDWLVVAEFQNQTGEEIFDKSLNALFSVALGQSSYVNVVPASRIQDALRQMRRSPQAPLDADTAREIAQREHVKLVLAPAISNVGGVYVLSASVLDPITGASLATATARASDQKQVVGAVDELVDQVRRKLGEAASAIAKQDAPLYQATTSSLEALRLLSLGAEKMRMQQFQDARTLLQEAIRLDPEFTLARTALGQLEWEFFDKAKGKALMADAVQKTEHLTFAEKCTVQAFDAQVRGDLPAAAEAWRSMLLQYPDRAAAHNNLGRVLHQLWRLEEAANEYREAIRLEQSLFLTYYSLNTIYLYDTGDLDASIELTRRELALFEQNFWAHSQLGAASLGKGDLAGAAAQFERALQLDGSNYAASEGLGHTYRKQKRYADALKVFTDLATRFPNQPEYKYSAAMICRQMGDEPGARRYLMAYRDLVQRSADAEPWAAFDLAVALERLGLTDQATAAGQRALTMAGPVDSVWRSVYINWFNAPRRPRSGPGPDSHFDYARLLAAQKKTAEAIDAISTAIDNGYRNVVWIMSSPDMDDVVADPRFKALMAKSFPAKPR